MLSLLDADSAEASAIVDFIRGDDSNEQDQGGTYSFRARGSKLGDIVHSSPLLAGNVLYVGSNNGMLHAFDVDTGDEIFAYVPRLVFESLNKLTVANPSYAHTYFIDQSPFIANVGGSNLLVNTLGKGGKGVFCLDLTNITNAELNANSIVKWEFPANSTNPDNSPDPDMGYGFSRAFIVNSNAGPVVIFGNGYDSTNESAVLFILNPVDGSVLARIDTGVGTPDPGDCNGLSTPALIDIDMDQKVDFAYAGDLLGNMWKFDLRDSNVNNWGVAYNDSGSPQPLFQAKNALGHRQPITMKPDVMRHCMANRAGYMVLFGTGRHLGNADFADNSVQTLYGIWDWQDAWEAAGLTGPDKSLGSFTPTRMLSNLDGIVAMPTNAQNVTLLEQTQVFFGSEFGEQFRVISDNMAVWYLPGSDADFAGITSHAGWYFDLPANSERAFKDVLIYGGVNIAISSIPSDSPCSAGGDSILHAMNACTGARLDAPFYDANNDGVIDSDDLINIGSLANPIWVAPTGWFKSGMYYPPAILSLGGGQSMLYFGTSDATVDPTRTVSEPLGLTDWREIE
jgi:type IV pilus assembly protein PilY1